MLLDAFRQPLSLSLLADSRQGFGSNQVGGAEFFYALFPLRC